jgi:hypothetical protein
MQTKIVGGGVVQIGPELVVDPTFNAARVALRPLDYANMGQILGHYRATGVTGASVSISAGGIISSLRWPDPQRFLVLNSIQVSVCTNTSVTTSTVVDLGAYICRGFTADDTGGTAISLVGNYQKNRAVMGSSLVNSLRIGTTGAIASGTRTQDAVPFAASAFPMLMAVTATGTAVASPPGMACPVVDLYRWNAFGQHPIVLGYNEGIELCEITAGPASGSLKWYITWDWAEVVLF